MEFINLENYKEKKIIDGVVIHPLKINKDESGVLVETLRNTWEDVAGKDREFVMQYFSITPSGLARDEDLWHYHPGGQEDRFEVISGEIIVAIADAREDSSTKGLLNLFYINSMENPYMILVPKRTLHGFMVVSKGDGILLNFPTRLYDPKEEGRISYSEAKITMEDGTLFSWKAIRDNFNF